MAIRKGDIVKLKKGDELFLPSLSVDCVIFGFHENQLKVLLMKLKHDDMWSLPGGFIGKNETVDEAALRVLKERTGFEQIFLQQFNVFGDPYRSDGSIHKKWLKHDGLEPDEFKWLLRRFVTVGYYALVEYSFVEPHPDNFSEACAWHDVENLPSLMMDHLSITQKALNVLREHLNFHPVGYNLLPEKFTMPELQKLYETILNKQLDRRNFQRRMLSFGILRRLNEKKKGVAHKAPYLYSFDLRKYNKALKEGFYGGW
ncbi:MAG: NUDIX hydrolase [Bacteroidetes bacterium]|nr:NUDIX hydrolase [Bacteroidota bacterium]